MIENYSFPSSSTRTQIEAKGHEELNEFVLGPGLDPILNKIDRVHCGGYERNHLESLNTNSAFTNHLIERYPFGPDGK